jgi:hypothetical protein
MVDISLLPGVMDAALHHWKVSIGASLLIIPTVTYLITSIWLLLDLQSTKDGREPPLKPYWVPFLGDLFPFLLRARTLILDTQ